MKRFDVQKEKEEAEPFLNAEQMPQVYNFSVFYPKKYQATSNVFAGLKSKFLYTSADFHALALAFVYLKITVKLPKRLLIITS